jgi:WD40 repeat protein
VEEGSCGTQHLRTPLPRLSLAAAVCLLSGGLLASCGADRSLRLWDLAAMKEVAAAPRAHATPLHGLDYCPGRHEVATCSQVGCSSRWLALGLPWAGGSS